MEASLYDSLLPWYPLLDPREDHAEECREYTAVLRAVTTGGRPALLELGAGAGNNGTWLKKAFDCTLSDLSEGMLDMSRAANPDCLHVVGDMRTLRLDRTFDAVMVHDAICHMLTVSDLRAALATVFVHTRPGGVALLVPDCFEESFVEWTDDAERSDGPLALQYTARFWDPDPTDQQTCSDYVFLLRDGSGVTPLHVRQREGLFPRQLWLDELAALGFRPQLIPRNLPQEEAGGPYATEMLLAHRPA